MNKFVLSFLVLFAALNIVKADEENEIRYLKPFNQIEVSRGVEVVLTQSTEYNALIISEYHAMDEVLTEVSGNTLKISMAKNTTGDVNVEVRLSFVDLTDIIVKGNAIVRATHPLDLKNISIKGNTGGLIQLKINSDIVQLSAGEGTVIRVEGTCKSLDAKCATNSTIYADKLASEDVIVKAGIASKAFVSTKKSVDAKATSGGVITVTGKPGNITTSTSLGGKIELNDIEGLDNNESKTQEIPQS